MTDPTQSGEKLPTSAKSSAAVIDPVCGMKVLPEKAAGSVEHQGKIYYFCGKSCVARFTVDPEKFLRPDAMRSMDAAPSSGLVQLGGVKTSAKPASAASAAATYVCPMDPEVRESKPGACPVCGMALEPEHPVAATRVEYTCPMHPEIVSDKPGSCPICGMALEPRSVTATAEDDSELRSMSRRLWVSAVLTLP